MRWGRWWRREITRNICAQWDLCSLPDTCDPPSSPPPTHPQIPHCPHRGNHDPFPYSSARALPIPTTLWDHSLLELVCKHCCKKCYHLGALKEQKFILLLFRRLEVRTEGIGRVRSFLGAPRSIVPCLSPGGRRRPLAFLGFSIRPSNLSPPSRGILLRGVCVSTWPSFKDSGDWTGFPP